MTKKSNKPDIAVALQYDGKNAPRVTAKGKNKLAKEIRELADKYDVPLYEDTVLAQVLSQIELGEEIPPALYLTVAQVIAFTYLMAGRISPVPPGDKKADEDVPLLPSL